MPLKAEGSLVADSTLSTSPRREESASPPIKRAARTYGRKRSPLPVLDASLSHGIAEEGSNSKSFRAAPQDIEESVPSTSDNENNGGGDTASDSDGPDAAATSRKFNYGGWRKDLQNIDREFDEDDSTADHAPKDVGTASPTSSFGFGAPSLLSNDDAKRSTSPSLVNDIFGSSPADRSRAGPSRHAAGSDDDDDSFVPKKRLSRRVAAQDSDSEVEQPTTSPPVGTSPSAGPTLSPGSRRESETPPTSDNGMPTAKLQRKGKGRTSIDHNRTVPPLELQAINDQKATQSKKLKVKKPSKKEEKETLKDRVRINVEREVKVQPTHRQAERFSKTALLADLAGTKAAPSIECIPTSEDPINPFSSQGEATIPSAPIPFPAFLRTPSPTPPPIAGPSKPSLPEIPILEDDDDELPSMMSVMQETKKPAAASSAKEELRKRKLELLKKQQATARKPANDEEDDLEVVESSRVAAIERLEHQHANKAGKKDISQTRKQHMALAGIRPPKTTKGKKKAVETVRREDFDQQVLMKAQMEARAITKQKEDEWKAMGGSVRKEAESGVKPEDVFTTLAAHALGRAEASAQRGETFEQSDSEDSEDGDYKPEERGSASPEPEAMDEDEREGSDGDIGEDVTMGGEEDEETSVEAPESSENVRPRAGRRRVIASDDEEDENDENAPPQREPRQPFSALGGRGENDMEIVLDRRSPSTDGLTNDEGTDKENDSTTVRGRQVRFDSPDFDENAALSLDLSGPRRPLQEISSAPDTPKPLDLRTNLTQLFEAQLRTPQPSPGPSLRPMLGGALGGSGSGGFSQFTQSDRTLGAEPSSGDLSALFDATTQKLNDNAWSPQRGGMLAEAFVEKPSLPNSPKKGHARRDSLGLTQDLAAERMLSIKETQMRKADAVFEKEQEYLLEAALEASPKIQKEKLYVNEYGFLTQTRPNGEAEEYEPRSPSQIPGTRPRSVLQTPLDKGIPLTEPSTFDNLEGGSPPVGPLRRLRKRDTSPSERVSTPTEKRPRDAFEALREGAKGHHEARGKRRKLDAREYVAGEAEESDDEGGFWGIKKKKQGDDEEDEDGEDLDRTLEALVDDQDMDDETLAEDRVREKYKEDEALADKKVEEEAQAIIEGRRRTRRKNRDLMGEGSDDESDDEENEERRRKMARRMKRREDVEKLENNPLTKAFADTYSSTVLDDDQDFAHLATDDTEGVLGQLRGRRDEDDEYEDDEDAEIPEDEDEETQPRAMDPFELRQKVRDMRQSLGTAPVYDEEDGMDLADTTWVDSMDGEEETRVTVKTIKTVVKKPHHSTHSELDPSALDDGFEDGNLMSNKRPDERHQQQGQVWAKREGRNRNTATARSVGAAAVTGLAKAKSGGGSLRHSNKAATANGATGEKARPAVQKAESILISRLGDKSSRFTS